MSIAPPPPPPSPARRSLWFHFARVAAAFFLLMLLAAGGLLFYTSTPHFTDLVRRKVVAQVENATGGRVEIQGFHWNVLHLSVEVDKLTIHGLEGPGQAPYVYIDRLYVQAKIISLAGSRIGLRNLEIDRPVIHLIVYPDGSTNQPTPKVHETSDRSLTDTIFDLEANRVDLNHGVALLNQRALHFNFRANDLEAVVRYAPASGHYLGELAAAELRLQPGTLPPFDSALTASVEVARNAARLKTLHFTSGSSALDATGTLTDFAHPQWKFTASGVVNLAEGAALALQDNVSEGMANIELQGRGAGIDTYLLDGTVKLTKAGYRASYLQLSGVNGAAQVRVTPDEIALPSFSAALGQGGRIEGSMRYLHWRSPPAASYSDAPASQRRSNQKPAIVPAGSIQARVQDISLRTLMQAVAPSPDRNLGFATLGSGPVNVAWTGDAADLTVSANLQLRHPLRPSPGDAPLDGTVIAQYFNRGGWVQIKQLQAQTPASTVDASGSLGVYPLTRASNVELHVKNDNLAEFDRVLTTLGFTSSGAKGAAAIPVHLHGMAEFDGSLTGSLADPAVAGHVTASNFSTRLDFDAGHAASAAAPRRIRWDRLEASGSYSSQLIAIDHATLTQGSTAIHFAGRIHAHIVSARHKAFDGLSALNLSASMHNASLPEILAVAGQDLPATGEVNLQAHAGGTLDNLSGGAEIALPGGEIEGQPYRDLHASLAFSGREIQLNRLVMQLSGGSIVANGNYRLDSKTYLANLDGTGFRLARIAHLQDSKVPVDGSLKFDAHASGAFETPSILAGIHLDDLVVGGQPAGGLDAVAHTQGDTALFTVRSRLTTPQIHIDGRMQLRGDLATEAKVSFSGFDIAPVLKMLHVENLTGSSIIDGTANLAGPARRPKEISGDAEIDRFSLSLQGIRLENRGPLRGSLRNGAVHLTQVRIVGPETDLAVTGSASLLGERLLDLSASGAVNMKLAQTFDPDITSSGHVDFNIDARGTLDRPSLSGQARLTNVALALNDLPNGISRLNGTLVFNQNRLEVQNLVGTTGGGQLSFGGFITYQQGIYGDLTATGKSVRVRYAGVSATADASLHLQGSEHSMVLSGNVLITRFLVGQNLDFANFAASPATATLPDPNAPSNHVRLDVHITSSPQLDFQNSYAQLAGSVDLRIRGTVAQPALLGRINITEGTATFAGTTYQLQRGEIYFTNPVVIEPIVDLDATTRIEEYNITIGLHGSTRHLTPVFRSDPPLPQADVISLLALGRTQEEQQFYTQEEQQVGMNPTTNALLSGALNAAVGSRMQRLFGSGSVKIDPSYVGSLGSSSARITVQQNLTRNIQVTYATNVNAQTQQFIQGQVDLTDNISIVAQQDEAGVFSLVLKVHKRLR